MTRTGPHSQCRRRADAVLLAGHAGVLEVLPGGSGFLRSSAYGFQASPDDVFVPQALIRRYGLRDGGPGGGPAGPPPGQGQEPAAGAVHTVNGLEPEARASAGRTSAPSPPPTPTTSWCWSAA